MADGQNDSDSIVWVNLDEINLDNSSPLVLKAKEELISNPKLDKTIYNNWQIK